MQFEIISRDDTPAASANPLSEALLFKSFEDLLPQAKVRVRYAWYPNTSDVLIASSSFETATQLDEWDLQLIATSEPELARIQELLLSDGLHKLADWFTRASRLLTSDPTVWICYSVTARYENNELLFDERQSRRESPRPEHGWPNEPYMPTRIQ